MVQMQNSSQVEDFEIYIFMCSTHFIKANPELMRINLLLIKYIRMCPYPYVLLQKGHYLFLYT